MKTTGYTRREFLKTAAVASTTLALPWQSVLGARKPPTPPPPAGFQVPLDPKMIPKFVDPLPTLAEMDVIDASTSTEVVLDMVEFGAEVLPAATPLVNPDRSASGRPLTWAWGYKHAGSTRKSYIGPVMVARRGTPTQVRFVNKLGDASATKVLAYKNSTDQTLAWADPLNDELNACAILAAETPGQPANGGCGQNYLGPIPACVHIHGGEVPAGLDGGPDAWFTPDGLNVGHGYYTKGWLGFFGSVTALPKKADLGSVAYVRTTGADRGLYEYQPAARGKGGSWVKKTVGEAVYRFPNTQESAPVWFHDHTLGATRLNVYAGLAGAYYLTDSDDPENLPELAALVIQDRMFDTNGQLYFPAGLPFIPNPDHPFWVPEFVGDVICVNGKAWPYMEVQPKRYQFLLINGSNARTYRMWLEDSVTSAKGPVIWQIGTDGGYLDDPAKIDPNAAGPAPTQLVLMPGERATIIVDFAGLPGGTALILKNNAKHPFPNGAATNGGTTGTIMMFRVVGSPVADTSYNPASATPGSHSLRPENPIERLANPVTGAPLVQIDGHRQLTVNEVMALPVTVNGIAYPGGPLEVVVNNTKYMGIDKGIIRPDFTPVVTGGNTSYYSEIPTEGTVELWEIINLTADAHPMHLHLVQFQILSRQAFDVAGYLAAYAAAYGGVVKDAAGPPFDYNLPNIDGAVGGNPPVSPFLTKAPVPPAPNEAGWKDTVRVMPGEVTRILVRWAPTDVPAGEVGWYPFKPCTNNVPHGYVWHCHIVDHEDNEMMRPFFVAENLLSPPPHRTYFPGIDY